MKPSEIIWTPKMQAVINDESQIIFLVGATGCSKSLIAGIKFMDWLFNSQKEESQFYIICENIGTGVRNLLKNPDSFYNLFDFCREPYTPAKEGGIQFIFHGKYGDKTVYIVGADDRRSWSKILGSNPDGLWLEELSVLHIDCIREAMGRALSRKCKLIGTTNGGLPTQEFYTEFVNHSKVIFRETVPAIELSEMTEDKPYMHYYHFNMEDDAPHLSQEDKEKLRELYPNNSFYYNSKILGCRGFVQGAAYAPLMTKGIHLRPFEDVNLNNLKEIVLSVDVGASTDITDVNRAATIATLIGYSKDYQRIVILECWPIPSSSHDEIIKQCEEKIEWWWVKYMNKFSKIIIDSAENILINTWSNKNKFRTITVKGSVKVAAGKAAVDKIDLVSRCRLKQQLLLQQRLIWSSHAINSYNAHTRIMLDDDGKELDLCIQDNDFGDSLTYGLTENWNYITKQTNRR